MNDAPKPVPEHFWAAADRIVASTRLAGDRRTLRAARVTVTSSSSR
jgi:hypothetical protein